MTHLGWQCVIILLSASVGVAVSRKITRASADIRLARTPALSRHVYLASLVLLFLPVAGIYMTAHPSLHWEMPCWLQLHYITISWGTISALMAYVFALCSYPAVAGNRPWKWAPATCALLLLSGIEGYLAWRLRPDPPPLSAQNVLRDGVILQTYSYTCVPAAGANIAAMVGVPLTEKQLADACGTTKDGTYPAQILAALELFGISGKKRTIPAADVQKVKPPAMLFVLGDIHAVVYAGITNGRVQLLDPGCGRRLVREEHLRAIWQGHALEFTRTR